MMSQVRKKTRDSLNGVVSRRDTLRGAGAAGIAAVFALPSAHRAVARQGAASSLSIEPGAGSWKTWILATGDQVRPGPPPDEAATAAELDGLQPKDSQGSSASSNAIACWDAGSPGYRWNEIAMQQTLRLGFGPGDAYRTMALLNAAIYDATVAVWDARYTYNRPRPVAVDLALQTAIPTPVSPSYPSEYADTAAVAATVLSHLFPDAAGTGDRDDPHVVPDQEGADRRDFGIAADERSQRAEDFASRCAGRHMCMLEGLGQGRSWHTCGRLR